MKEFKDFLQAKGITKEDFEEKESKEMAELYNEYNTECLKNIQGGVTANKVAIEEIPSLEDALKDYVKNDKTFKDIRTQLDEVIELASELKDDKKGGDKKVTMTKAFEDNKEAIIALVKGTSKKEVVIKADTVRASITNNTDALRLPDIGQLGVIERSLYNIFPKFPVSEGDHRGVIRYHDWDEATTVRAADMIAEGGTFPEATAKFQEFSLDLKKVGDTLPVSEEFGSDAPSAAAELEMFLDTNVETKIDDQLVNGDGTGQELTGLITSVPAYSASGDGITDANIFDLVKRVKTDIVKTRGSKYKPNFVAMNSNTIDDLQLKKDANNNYIFPDKSNIGSMIIVEENNLADNVLVVGDTRYGRIYEMGGVVLTRGLTASQFVEDQETIKARKRLLFLIRTVDKTGFRKVTDIDAALVTLAS